MNNAGLLCKVADIHNLGLFQLDNLVKYWILQSLK
jgi:hypothetical protein